MYNGYAIAYNDWIFDNRIKNELPLLLYISSLTALDGVCFASNTHFAEKFKESEVNISRKIKKLETLKYIDIQYQKRGAEVIKRNIRLSKMLTDDYQKCYPTINKNVKDNNTSINNTSINIKNIKKETESDNLIIPDYIDKELWDDWVQHRKDLKKPLTKVSIKQQLELLEENKYNANEIIKQSINNGWAGLFKIKEQKNNGGYKTRAEKNKDFLDEFERKYLLEQKENSINVIDTVIDDSQIPF